MKLANLNFDVVIDEDSQNQRRVVCLLNFGEPLEDGGDAGVTFAAVINVAVCYENPIRSIVCFAIQLVVDFGFGAEEVRDFSVERGFHPRRIGQLALKFGAVGGFSANFLVPLLCILGVG